MRNLGLALVAIAIALIAGNTVRATETIGGERIIVTERVNDDLVAAGRTVEIRAVISGDLTVAGADIDIEEPVTGYAMVAGRNVDVNAPVHNDLWAAGASVEINAPIGDNAVLAGREVSLYSRAAVRGDARIAADTARIEAPVERNLSIAARSANIGSEIGGSVEARVRRLRLLPGAMIRGDLIVHGPNPPEISTKAKVLGQIQFNEIATQNRSSWLFWWLFGFAALLILGFAAVALSPLWAKHVAAKISERPAASAMTGLMGLALMPITVVLLLVTVVGIPLAVILLALYVVAILLSGVFVAYLAGGWLLERTKMPDASPRLRAAVGALAVSLLMSLPWIGGIAQLIVVLIGSGALVLERRDSRQRLKHAVETP